MNACCRWYGRNHVVQAAEKDGHMAIALHWASFDNLVEKFNITNAIFYHEVKTTRAAQASARA
jgi:hypothetical protein